MSTRSAAALILLALTCVVTVCPSASAQQSTADSLRAETAFNEGVIASRNGDWTRAVALFEESMLAAPRPSTAYNLAIAHAHLHQYESAIRYADMFRELADPARHAESLREIARLRDNAVTRVARLTVRIVPAAAEVRVDETLLVDAGRGDLWLAPGSHRIEARAEGFTSRVLDIELVTAQHAVVAIELVPLEAPGDAAEEGLHRHERAADAEPGDAEDGRAGMTPPTASRSLARSAVDWGLLSVGVMAMGTAFTLDLLAFRHAENLGRYDPAAPGFLNASVQYRRIRGAGFGMGIGGSAALLVTVSSRTWFDSDRFRWGALSAGVPASILGVVLFVRTPRRIADTTLTEPHRALGALLLGVGVSLSLVPLSAWLRRRIRRGLDRRIVVTPTLAGLELLGRF